MNLSRQLTGEHHPKSKLQPEEAEDIRRRDEQGEKHTRLAAEYGVHRKTIFRIVNGQSYPPEE